jgi:hypothetical protein
MGNYKLVRWGFSVEGKDNKDNKCIVLGECTIEWEDFLEERKRKTEKKNRQQRSKNIITDLAYF